MLIWLRCDLGTLHFCFQANYTSNVSICLCGFDFDTKFKKLMKTFEFRGLKLKIRRMYQNIFKSCDLKHVRCKVRIKELSKKRNTFFV